MGPHAKDRDSAEGRDDDGPAVAVRADERDVTPDGKPTNRNVAAVNAPEARTTRSNPDGRTDNFQILAEFRLGAGPRIADRSPRATRSIRWLDAIPVAAAGIDRSAPDDVPGLADSRDTDATIANVAIDGPPADTPGYSIAPADNSAETASRTPSTGRHACHVDARLFSHNIDLTMKRAHTEGGPREPVTLTDQASGRSDNSFPRRLLRSLLTHQIERQTVLLVSPSDYNTLQLRIKPTPKSTPRALVRTGPRNWYRSQPLLTSCIL